MGKKPKPKIHDEETKPSIFSEANKEILLRDFLGGHFCPKPEEDDSDSSESSTQE